MEVVNDDSSGTGSDSDPENEELLKEIESKENEIESSPYGYENHIQLIKLYRRAGDLDGARKARNNMAKIFPLSESLWLEWIRDELPLASIPEAFQDVKSLFDRAVEDYMSVQVWIEYCSFALERMAEMGGVNFVRDVFEKAIMCVGLHTSDGGLCWNMYKDFEKTVFQSLQEMQANDEHDEELKQQVESQYERIDKLFKRHLGVPVSGLEDVFLEYQSFSDSVVNEESLPNYTRAKNRLKTLEPYEEELLTSTDSLDVYKRYIEGLKQAKEEPTLVDVVFQRALADNPLQRDLWAEYLSYLNKNFSGVAVVLLKGHNQAVRNCPWVKDFWISFVQAQERMKVTHEQIIATFDQALGDNFSDSQSFLDLWTCYCDYLRRRTVDLGEGEINDLRRLFRRAREHLDTYFGSNGDPSDSLSRYQASLEAHCYSNMEEARLLWTDVMKHHGREADYWSQYAELERGYGDPSLCRKVLLMGVNSASDNPEKICNQLLQFEREQGTLETYLNAVERCESQLTRVKERKEKAVEKEQQKKDDKRQQRKERRKQAKEASSGKQDSTQPASAARGVSGKRKRQEQTFVFYESDQKEAEDIGVTEKKKFKNEKSSVETTAFVPSTDNSEKMEVQQTTPLSPPMDVDRNKEQEVEGYDPLKWLAREDNAGTTKGQKSDNKGKEKKEETVFISNLTFNTTEEQLRDIFQNCGEISDIRLIKTRKSGGGNVFAYVEFSSVEPVQQALLLDRQVLNHRPMYVSPCEKSTSQPKDTKPKYSEETTVYVTNIPFNVNEQQLQEIFKEAGEIKEVRLVRNRQGRSKGFAYIEYTSEANVSTAVLKLDGYSLNGRNLNVAVSKPPSSKSSAERPQQMKGGSSSQQITSTTVTDSNQQSSTSLSFGSKRRIPMVPRAVVRKGPAGASSDDTGAEMGIKRSNEDFRNLLLKKD